MLLSNNNRCLVIVIVNIIFSKIITEMKSRQNNIMKGRKLNWPMFGQSNLIPNIFQNCVQAYTINKNTCKTLLKLHL